MINLNTYFLRALWMKYKTTPFIAKRANIIEIGAINSANEKISHIIPKNY